MSEVRRKVILVDDIKFGLQMGKQKLQEIYEVYPAISATRMFAILENVRPDVILLDINMPGCCGYEAIKQLKADPRFTDIPVIFVTSRSDEDSVVEGISLGAADHIVKPFSVAYLQERIENLLNPQHGQKLEQEESSLHAKNANKPCVLAVDDVPYMLRSIQYALRHRFNVYTLSRPEKIEEFLRQMKVTPELFLLDFNMPEMDGYDLFLKIREFPEHKQTPIIFLTSDGTMDNVTVAINLGAVDFVVKPFSSSVLREKVAKHIYKEEYFV
ncbi:MAG: response regulator [Planctomycetaceae bacterium]|nr:response regulator [Planctomycetaceae bacterium]